MYPRFSSIECRSYKINNWPNYNID
jgi:hypothetical protein